MVGGNVSIKGLSLLASVSVVMLMASVASAQNVVTCEKLKALGNQSSILCAGGSIHVTINREGDRYEQAVPWETVDALVREVRAERASDESWRLESSSFRRRLETRLEQWAADHLDQAQRLRSVAWVSAVAGAAVLLSGIVFAAVANAANQRSAQHCTGNSCDARGQDERNSALSKASAADALFISGLAIGVAGGIGLYIFDLGEVSADAGSVRGPGPEALAVTIGGTW